MCAATEEPILTRLERTAEVLEKELTIFLNDFEMEVDRLDELIDGPNLKPATKGTIEDGKPLSRFRALESRLNRVRGIKDQASGVLEKLRRNIDQLRGGGLPK